MVLCCAFDNWPFWDNEPYMDPLPIMTGAVLKALLAVRLLRKSSIDLMFRWYPVEQEGCQQG